MMNILKTINNRLSNDYVERNIEVFSIENKLVENILRWFGRNEL